MSENTFHRDHLAEWYARQHLTADPSISDVYFLPDQSPERDIRLIEINTWAKELNPQLLEPLDFSVDMGTKMEHTLRVVDVTPGEWAGILEGSIHLPSGWSLGDCVHFRQESLKASAV